MKKRFFSFLIFILLFTNAFSASITIPNSVIGFGVSRIFPIKKENTFSDIEIKYNDFYIENNKLKISLNYEANALTKKFNGNILINSDLRYDEVQKELFFKDIEIETITNNGKEYNINNSKILKSILKQAFKLIENKSFLNKGYYMILQ